MNKFKNYIFGKKENKITTGFFTLLLVLVVVSCDDINSIHQKYYDWGEGIYTGVIDSLKAFPGYQKVRFNWEINADPRMKKTIIYWNQRKDSVVIDVNRTQSGRIRMTYDLLDMKEGNYIFEFITRDDERHFSIAKELVVFIYGESYSKLLRNRMIASIKKQLNGDMLITWEPIFNKEIQYVTIRYTDNDVEKTVPVKNQDTKTLLSGLHSGDKIYISTVYLPLNALEVLTSYEKEYIMP